MRRTLEGFQNPRVQIVAGESLVDDIALIFEDETPVSNAQLPTPPPQIIGEQNCGSYNHRTTSTRLLSLLMVMIAVHNNWRQPIRLSNKSWLYDSNASVLNTDDQDDDDNQNPRCQSRQTNSSLTRFEKYLPKGSPISYGHKENCPRPVGFVTWQFLRNCPRRNYECNKCSRKDHKEERHRDNFRSSRKHRPNKRDQEGPFIQDDIPDENSPQCLSMAYRVVAPDLLSIEFRESTHAQAKPEHRIGLKRLNRPNKVSTNGLPWPHWRTGLDWAFALRVVRHFIIEKRVRWNRSLETTRHVLKTLIFSVLLCDDETLIAYRRTL
ncbi:hypothetical protein CLF_101094 [Clonorchis sinensis]|uniref:Uncharacterized protein n=1 Tax=Clonorchis sinensis TaxID=79923 RepID=G7Y4Y3_CLOSI|nr:hypothetical protein CLF_101094 [Clonorchis sinensis]